MEKHLESEFVDQLFHYEGLWDAPSICGLKVVKKDTPVVIATELYQDNPGSSITDCNTKVAMKICKEFNLDPENFVFIEHTPDRKSRLSFNDETFFKVKFDLDGEKLVNPQWSELTKDEAVNLIS